MTYENFKMELTAALMKSLTDIEDIEIKEFTKNNNVILDGMLLKQKGVNISQTIYLNEYFELYKQNVELDFIAEQIADKYRANIKTESMDIDFFTDFEKAKEKIIFKLVNRAYNLKLLQDVPHMDFLDLAIVFCYYSEDFCQGESGTITIRNEHMKLWNTDCEMLYKLSVRNTPRILGVEVNNICEIVGEIMGDTGDMFLPEEALPMYVLTNSKKVMGAGTLAYENLLQELADAMDEDLYVIPSSVHEIIFIPAREEYKKGAESMKETISYVNSHELSAQDILSDNLYYYSRKEQKLVIA